MSYIITTKNRAKDLDRALIACRKLVGLEDEVIVVDGGSTDETEEVVKKYADIVSFFVSEPDLDSFHAQNKGMLLASGRYVKQLGDDDVYYPEATERAIQIMDEHPEIDLLLSGGTKGRKGERLGYIYVHPGVNYGKSAEDIFRYNATCGCGHFIRRKALALGGLCPVTQGADAWYILQFIQRGCRVKFCRINTFHHPINDEKAHSKLLTSGEIKRLWRQYAKEYCSTSFYLYYIISQRVKDVRRFWLLNKIRGAYNFFLRILGKKSYHLVAERLWDGGFS